MSVLDIFKRKNQKPATAEEEDPVEADLLTRLVSGSEEKARETGGSLAIHKTKKTINNLVKEKRLVFVGDDKLIYTNRAGIKASKTFFDMAMVLYEAAGSDNMLQLRITPNDIKALVVAKYDELHGSKK